MAESEGILCKNHNLMMTWFFFMFLLYLRNSEGAHGKAINSFAGPYIAYVSKFHDCDNGSFVPSAITWKYSVRLTRFNPAKPMEPQRVTGNITGTAPINDTYWLRLKSDKWNNNQWKENAFIFFFPTSGCSNMLNNGPFTTVMFGKLWKRKKNPCEITPGTNKATDAPIVWEFPNIPILPYFQYRLRVETNVIGQQHPAFCTVAEGAIIPRV